MHSTPTKTPTNTLANSILVFVAGSSYGFIVPVIKMAHAAGVHPSQLLPLQYLIAFALCTVAMLVTRTRLCAPRKLLTLALLGLNTGTTSLCYYRAVALLPSAVALTMLFQYVWISIVIDCIARRKLPNASSIVSAAIVLVGTLFAAGIFGGTFGALDPMGIAFGFGSAVFYALYLYLAGIIGTDQPVLLRTTMLAAGGLAITSLANPAVYVTNVGDATTWAFSAVMALIGILVPTALINFSSPKLSNSMVSIMASSELPVGIFAAWAMIGDAPTPLVLFGACLVMVGIVSKQVPGVLRGRG